MFFDDWNYNYLVNNNFQLTIWQKSPQCNQIHILVDQDAGSEFLSWITGNMYAGTTVINDKWLVINSLNGQA